MSSLAPNDHPEAPLFSDGLGERVVAADGATGELLQILRLRPALTSVPSFEFALRERAARLANFRHAYYARVRRVDRAMAPTSALAIVSDHLEGTRLSDILRVAQDKSLQIDINAALCLIRQLVPAIAVLHENARDVAHGLIAPERLIVTPNARLVIVEHLLGTAIEQLAFERSLGRSRASRRDPSRSPRLGGAEAPGFATRHTEDFSAALDAAPEPQPSVATSAASAAPVPQHLDPPIESRVEAAVPH